MCMSVLPSQLLPAVQPFPAHCVRNMMQEGKGGKTMVSNAFIHTTDPDSTAVNTQSVLENNDLTELMSMVSQQDFSESTSHHVHPSQQSCGPRH